MNDYKIKKIINEVFDRFLKETPTFKPGESIVIGGNETLGRKVIKSKYGLNPDDFDYVGNGKFVYKLRGRSTTQRQTKPKTKKQYLGRKEDETEQEYLERVRELNPRFADIEKEMPGEKWRPVKNTGRYFGGSSDYSRTHEVSNMGRIRTIDFNDPMRSRISTGYDAPTRNARQFHLDVYDEAGDAQKTTPPIHTMVADAWLKPPQGNIEDYDVVHIDGNYHNNSADNLKYVLRKGRRGRKSNNKSLPESIKRIISESIKNTLRKKIRN